MLKNYMEKDDGEYHSTCCDRSSFPYNSMVFFWMDRQ
jgi:hypothetical protein